MSGVLQENKIRVNAQLDEKNEQDLQFIKEQTGESITRIINELLAEKVAQLRKKQQAGAKMKDQFLGYVQLLNLSLEKPATI